MRRLLNPISIIIVMLLPVVAYAGDAEADNPYADALITDRPDVADTSYAVGKLKFQIETSFEYIQDNRGGVTTRTYFFPTLLRFGIIDPLEFRVENGLYAFRTQTGTRYQHGFTDVAFGFKWHFLDAGPKGIPSMGLLAAVSAPTGEDEFSFNAWVPIFKLLTDFELPFNISIGINVGVDVPGRDGVGDKYADFLYAISFGYNVHRTDNRLRLFIEVSGISPMKSNKADIRTLNTGVAFLITPNVQVDSFVRVGITPSTPDMAGGLGWGFRFF